VVTNSTPRMILQNVKHKELPASVLQNVKHKELPASVLQNVKHKELPASVFSPHLCPRCGRTQPEGTDQ